MSNKILVIAPHPDDEILGCGGTLLRRKVEGAKLAWLIVTDISEQQGWSLERVQERKSEIAQITKLVGFNVVYNLRLPPAQLDTLPVNQLIEEFSKIFNEYKPQEIYLPHYSDVHTDHRIVFDITMSCAKWFRYPSIQRVLSYETISETDFGLRPDKIFSPNIFVNISAHMEDKIQLMSIYQSEMGDFPFPRSEQAVRAQATLRGAASGFMSAEAFQLLKERS